MWNLTCTLSKWSVFAAILAGTSLTSAASITFDDWLHNDDSTPAGYTVSINDDTAGYFTVSFSVDAGYTGKVSGLFFNFSEVFAGGDSLYNTGNVSATGVLASCFDVSDCGHPNNNLNGQPPAPWDLAFQVGIPGRGPASGGFSFATLGLTLDDIYAVGIRAQSTGAVGGQNGSDKAWSIREPEPTPVPEPGSIALLGLGLAGLAAARRQRKS